MNKKKSSLRECCCYLRGHEHNLKNLGTWCFIHSLSNATRQSTFLAYDLSWPIWHKNKIKIGTTKSKLPTNKNGERVRKVKLLRQQWGKKRLEEEVRKGLKWKKVNWEKGENLDDGKWNGVAMLRDFRAVKSILHSLCASFSFIRWRLCTVI